MGDSDRRSVRFITFLLLCLFPQVIISQTGPCGNMTYEHEGATCCQCAPGQYVKKHCSTNQQGECELCPDRTYTNQFHSQTSCERCTSCEQPNANLEVAEPCSPGQNTKCRCKKDHYCDSGTETCTLCQPCTKCDAVKVPCTINSDAVCAEKPEGISGGAIAAIVLIPILLFAGAAGFYIWSQQRRRQQTTSGQQSNGNALDMESQPLRVPDVDPQPHLSDIAQETGWKVIQDIARRSGIPTATIESCQLDYPNNSQEQTVKLLGIWMEKNGREAPSILVQMLQNSGRRATAEKVVDILSGNTSDPSA